ncbi:MAG: AbrB/MazE/SpoVT family DNA-binding domain-containing protein [Acidimicrobiia bacterium]
MTYKVGPKGQVVIPKDLRDEFGIEPGDEVVFWRDGDHVAVQTVHASRPLKGRFAGRALVDQLERDRTADRRREEAR